MNALARPDELSSSTPAHEKSSATPIETRLTRPGWRIYVLLWSLLAAVLVGANWRTTAYVAHVWSSDAYGHGPLVLIMSCWLVWRARRALASIQPRGSAWGLAALALTSLGWWLAYAIELRAGEQLAQVLALAAATWALLGWPVLRLLLFPLGYLALTLSAWDAVVHPLQDLTALLSADAVSLLGVPVLLENYYITIPEGRFLIDSVCAGLRYFLAGVTIGTFYAYLAFPDLWRRLVFVALSAAWAIAANVLRVVVVIMSGHLTDMQHTFVRNHGDFGWVLFGVCFIPLFGIGALLARFPRRAPRPEAQRPSDPPVTVRAGGTGARAFVTASGAAVLLAVPAAGASWLEREAGDSTVRLAAIRLTAPWSGPHDPPSSWRPLFRNADDELFGTFTKADRRVDLYVAFYARQRADAKVIYYGNRVFDKEKWQAVDERDLRVTAGAGSVPVHEVELRDARSQRHRLVWYSYYVGSRFTNRSYLAKLYQVLGVLTGRDHAAVLILGTDIASDPQAARDLLGSFVEAALPLIESAVQNPVHQPKR